MEQRASWCGQVRPGDVGATVGRGPLRPLWWALLALLLALIGGTAGAAPSIVLEPMVGGLSRPVGVVDARDGSGRLFIVEQGGRIRVWTGTTLLAEPFLDLTSKVSCCGERGLLGLAFHPDYADNGRLFVSYTDSAGDSVVEEYAVSTDPDVADAGSARSILHVDQPYSNHNGGHLAFGPDGYLYLGLGDGGGGGDPGGNAQDTSTLLGSILRLDVDGDDYPADPARNYAIPPDNPLVGVPGADEIWSWGLRNPWRFSFDRWTGDLLIGDVGQGSWEEIDLQPAAGGGENWGWRCYEGDHPYDPSGCGEETAYDFPILEYSHDDGCSVTGGFRYRGRSQCGLFGIYLYGDYCSGRIWAARPAGSGWIAEEVLDTALMISSFGEDAAGELYVVHLDDSDGTVYRIVSDGVGDVLFCDSFEMGDATSWSSASSR